jgi:transposase
MKKPAQHLIAEVPRRRAKIEITIGIDLGDVWSHSCTLNRTNPRNAAQLSVNE